MQEPSKETREGDRAPPLEPASVVVLEIVHQLNHICIESTLCELLHRACTLTAAVVEELDWSTRTKLQVACN